MYENMNPGIILVTGILLFMTLGTTSVLYAKSKEQKKPFKQPYILYFFVLVSVGMLYWTAGNTREHILSTTSLFNEGKELRCAAFTKSYLVSKPKGWHFLDKKSLTDGNIILSIELCQGI